MIQHAHYFYCSSGFMRQADIFEKQQRAAATKQQRHSLHPRLFRNRLEDPLSETGNASSACKTDGFDL